MKVSFDKYGEYVIYLTDIEPPEYYEPESIASSMGGYIAVYWYDITTNTMWYYIAFSRWFKLTKSTYDYGRVFSRQLEEFRELYV
jgi:hypothetical protein